MMKHWTLYRKADGVFTGRSFSCTSEEHLDANIPEGCAAVEGEHDYLSQRVDLETLQVVDWQPPQPSDDHEWNADRKRWLLKPAVVERNAARASAQAQIDELERKMLRALREDALGYEGAKARLLAIEDQIKVLRSAAAA